MDPLKHELFEEGELITRLGHDEYLHGSKVNSLDLVSVRGKIRLSEVNPVRFFFCSPDLLQNPTLLGATVSTLLAISQQNLSK